MVKKSFRVLFVFLVLAVVCIGLQPKNVIALELQSYPAEETVEQISEQFSLIDDNGMNFLFHKQKIEINSVSDVQVGKSYKFFSLQDNRLHDSGIVNYPLYLNGKVFALYTEYYDGEIKGSTAISSILDEYYYDEDLDYSDMTVVTDGKSTYVVSGSFIWHYEEMTLISKIKRDETNNIKEQQIISLIEKEQRKNNQSKRLSSTSLLINLSQRSKRNSTAKIIEVSVVPQYQSPTCWAAAVCAVGNYMTGPSNWTPDSISLKVKGEIAGGDTIDFIRALKLFRYPDSNQHISSENVGHPIGDLEIMNWINHETPFILRVGDESEKHAVTACGYICKVDITAIYVQDSASAFRKMLSRDGQGRFGYKFSREHYFIWEETIILPEWQRPGNSGSWVYFDHHGNYTVGWLSFCERWYYFSESGEMQTGWVKVNDSWYYFSGSGEMQTGWVYVDGYWYYLDDSGRLLYSQWLLESGRYYYLDSGGKMLTGWFTYQGNYYYLDSNGVMQTGWIKDQGYWYYLNSNGSMRTGWLVKDGSYYYLDSNGRMITGWYRISGDWYFFNSDGSMATGWLEREGSWYYLSSSGIMQTGWLNSSGHTFYLNQDGSMRTGWLSYGGSSYYLRYDNNKPVSGGPTGSMIYSQKARIGGVTYEFNARGEAYKALPGNIVPKAYKPLVEVA